MAGGGSTLWLPIHNWIRGAPWYGSSKKHHNVATLKNVEGDIHEQRFFHKYLRSKEHLMKSFWLVVPTPPKNISQIGNLPQIGVKIKNI